MAVKESADRLKWYHYLFGFLAGLFLMNTLPHFIHGIDGESFPTPFADPPGKGLSSPVVNILWALLNLAVGYGFYRLGKVSAERKWTVLAFFLGLAFVSLMFAVMAPSVLQQYKAVQ